MYKKFLYVVIFFHVAIFFSRSPVSSNFVLLYIIF